MAYRWLHSSTEIGLEVETRAGSQTIGKLLSLIFISYNCNDCFEYFTFLNCKPPWCQVCMLVTAEEELLRFHQSPVWAVLWHLWLAWSWPGAPGPRDRLSSSSRVWLVVFYGLILCNWHWNKNYGEKSDDNRLFVTSCHPPSTTGLRL